MEKIKIDREIRLMLLSWLKQGEINTIELERLAKGRPPRTIEEIESDMVKLNDRTGNAVCRCFKRLGICEGGKDESSTD